jgi:hypothetical protein
MKKSVIILFVFVSILGCTTEKHVEPNREITGVWVSYELVYTDGSIETGPFTTLGFFGAYSESIQFNHDNTYIPMLWIDEKNYTLSLEEAGNFEYISDTQELKLTGGAFEYQFEVTKFTSNILWLKSQEMEIRLKRESIE